MTTTETATKYEQMCAALGECQRRYSEFQKRSLETLARFVNEFVAHCEIPRDCVSYLNLEKGEEGLTTPGMKYTLLGSMDLANDGYWHMGLLITLATGVTKRIKIEFCLTERNGKPMVRFGSDGEWRELDFANQGQCREFYDEVVNDITRYLTKEPPQQLLVEKRFGFIPS